MLKKIAIGVVTVSAFGIATAALAGGYDNNVAPAQNNGSGFYVRGTLGYNFIGDTSKKVTAAVLTPLGITAFNPTIGVKQKNSDGMAGGLAVGYDFDHYFGLELGGNLYHDVKRGFSGTQTISGTNLTYGGTQKLKIYSIDLLGKVTIPFKQYYAFIDGGAAYVHVKYGVPTLIVTQPGVTGAVSGQSHSEEYIRPQLGAGIGYNINENVGVDVSYQRVFGKSKVDERTFVPSLNTVALGVTYKFAS